MKKIIAAIATAIVSLTATAQNSEVFYSPVNETMEIGIGMDRQSHKVVLSIIEESKKDVDFSIDIVGKEGNSIMIQNLNEGSLNVIPKSRKVNYYLCNYEISMPQLMQLVMSAKNNEKIMINGQEIEGSVLAQALDNIQQEMPRIERRPTRMPHRPMMGFHFRGTRA
ncbi:MAG: hypothetical protein MJZ36_10460 [Bacteroidaceae bacterium]|nr:hypothetical protein [Bacteroidaceae bacterium]